VVADVPDRLVNAPLGVHDVLSACPVCCVHAGLQAQAGMEQAADGGVKRIPADLRRACHEGLRW
jgi:hypothetical protein